MRPVLPQPLHEQLCALGAAPVHSAQLVRNWLSGQPLTAGSRAAEDFLPRRVRDGLPALTAWLDAQARVQDRHPAQDGSQRWLMALHDGQTVETVLLPRQGVCVSTQVGCAVGCTFCMTGRDGLLRQLGVMEILAQVAQARAGHRVRKVVFMGMGEPAHNLDAVLGAIEVLGHWSGIGHKNLVFSTVGDLRVFERLPLQRVRPALALSLHTTDATLRHELLPRAPRIDPADLVAMGETYARQTGYPIQYQWTLMEGVNDSDAEARALCRLLTGKCAVMNFIPFNAVAGSPYRRPSVERGVALVRQLRSHGVLATLRQSAGQDVQAGCGQLRARRISETVVRFAKPGGVD